MSGFNANFRNTATGDLSTFDGSADQYGSGNVPNIPPVLEPFLELSCGATVDSFIDNGSSFSFFRTQDVIANTKYRARQANMVADVPGRLTVTVTGAPFSPFISIVRSADEYEISGDGSGVAHFDVTEDNEGPITIEVTSVEAHRIGPFTISVTCGDDIPKHPTTTIIVSSVNPSEFHDKVTYTVTVTSPDGTPVGDVIISDDSGTLTTVTLSGGSATYSTAKQPIGSHPMVAAYQGNVDFDVSTGHLTQVVNTHGPTCPTGTLQLDATTVTFINDFITWRRNLPGGPYGGPADFTGIVPFDAFCTWLSEDDQTAVLVSKFTGPNAIQVFDSLPVNTNTAMQISFAAFSGFDPAGTSSTTFGPPGFSPSNPPNWPPPSTVTFEFI